MKTIKTAAGNRYMEDCAPPVALIRIREILTDHRNELINRLLPDLPTYISYKFNVKPDPEQLKSITDTLCSIIHTRINIGKYDSIVQEILLNTNTHVSSEPFYKEINKTISWELRPNRMVLQSDYKEKTLG
jgi:hypothetical protein